MKRIIWFSIFILILTGCGLDSQPQNYMNKKILMVIAPKDFRDSEYLEPRRIFDKAGVEVKVASIQRGMAMGADGAQVEIDYNVSEIDPNNFDAIVFVGGPGMIQILDDESLQILALKFYKAKKVTSAICAAPGVLAKAGILNGKKATSWEGVEEILEKNGAEYTGENVSVDGEVITARGFATEEFANKILDNLN